MKRLALFLIVLLTAITLAPVMAQNAQQQAQQAQSPQWVNARTPNDAFPSPPGQVPMNSQQQIQNAFPQTNYGAANYAVTDPAGAGTAPQNGIAPMPPLAPPSNYDRAEQVVSPFSNSEIVKLRQQLDDLRKAKAYHPVRTVPRISSISVDLSPGAALPIVRVLPGEQTTLVFVDSTGAPWPLAVTPRVSDLRYFDVEWLSGTPFVVISALSAYEDGNVIVFLQGMATPVVVKLATGEPDSKEKSRVVDYRLDLRVPGRGPNAQAPFLGTGRIALYDDTMQGFLDGIPPTSAKLVTAHGDIPAHTQVWQYGDAMFVRTNYDIQTAFDQSMFAADGTRVYRLPPTPYVTLSEMDKSVTLQLDIN
ncbi:DotH/IcmK family type IV secretion protein [Xylella fastidiosa]|uniref:DotH/IcmK family type IV secretion protein n=1 Tax=Xylella fastidiosa TaxID=2371 RepID=UPI000FEC8195|nr:DotH/IcmK family type IV secretion protein [Xylella fastidiosa]MRU28296.1 conjugal transfer protein TraN [Xylella fastidiosa subsp. multiplex]MRU30686.1 conjugal transfer protein TraN [Xylella fastidiosa subsp. multiplex]UIT53413.1 DotH/IcmK family type IV secretion protein [Xylella fastidiosa subsp. fastidiosa]WLE28529.1 DotH/IcmK family type IV secretion protein [Xylella fastidiosa subsp. multiplex]